MKAATRASALLQLGRVSNLPSVWSDVLTAFALANGGLADTVTLMLLLAGGTLAYTGGTTLNDAFDLTFDRQYRPDRPIPAGVLSRTTVWTLGLTALFAGTALLACNGSPWLATALAAVILLYDWIHKKWMGAVWIMASCRALLALTAASAVMGTSLTASPNFLHASALFLHTAAITFTARGESRPGPLRRWPLLLLIAPAPAAFAVRFPATPWFWIAAAAWLAWTVLAVRPVLHKPAPASIGATVSALLAAFVLVDSLFLSQSAPVLLPVALFLFLLARLLQRFVPAT